MKKQLILLVVSAFVLGGTLSSSPAMAGHQSGFSLVIVPNFQFPMIQQRVIQRDYYNRAYFYNQYPTHYRSIKNVRVESYGPTHQIHYVNQMKPVRVNPYRDSRRDSRER